jgi:hypothetical protein
MSQQTPATGSHNAVVVRAGQAETVGHRPTTVRPLADASVSATGGVLTTIRVATPEGGDGARGAVAFRQLAAC